MFGFFGSQGEKEEIQFDDVIGMLESIEGATSVDMSYRAGRNRENYLEIDSDKAKDLLRNKLSPARDFSLGERYDSVSSLAGAASVNKTLPEDLYTDAVHTVTEDNETAHHTITVTQGFLYRNSQENVKGRVLRKAELSYDLPLDQD